MRRHIQKYIALLVIATLFLTGCTIGDTEYVFYEKKVDDKSVFSVGTERCSIGEAKLYLCNYKNIYGRPYGIDLWSKAALTDSLEAYVRGITLAEAGRVFCMYELAKEQELVLTEAELKQVESIAKEYYESLSKEELTYFELKESDVVLAYEHYATALKLYSVLTEGVNEEVSDDEARVIRVEQIFVQDKETAETVSQKLSNGEDFEAVAGTYNKAEAMEIVMARGEYPSEVEDIVFSLDNNAISPMITVEGGYYFVKCLSKLEPELTEENKAVIVLKRQKEQFDDLYEEYVNNTDFILNDEVWSTITLEGTQGIETDDFFKLCEENFHVTKEEYSE